MYSALGFALFCIARLVPCVLFFCCVLRVSIFFGVFALDGDACIGCHGRDWRKRSVLFSCSFFATLPSPFKEGRWKGIRGSPARAGIRTWSKVDGGIKGGHVGTAWPRGRGRKEDSGTMDRRTQPHTTKETGAGWRGAELSLGHA